MGARWPRVSKSRADVIMGVAIALKRFHVAWLSRYMTRTVVWPLCGMAFAVSSAQGNRSRKGGDDEI